MELFDANSPDGTLVAAARAGQEEAFAHLVRRYRPALVKAAASRLRRREPAEEAVQETFLCAHRWLHTYDARYSFRTWLWTILLSQCARQARREAKHVGSSRWETSGAAGFAAGRQTGEPSPLDALVARENVELVNALLRRLPEAQADAVRLRFFGGLSFPEIAAAMQCSEAGAKHRVKAALLKLSKWLKAAHRVGGMLS